jgi:excisionase family DNA binding protein
MSPTLTEANVRDEADDVRLADKPEKLAYNVGEAAAAMGVSKSAVYHAIERGQLPSRRVLGRVVVLREHILGVLGGASSWTPRADER